MLATLLAASLAGAAAAQQADTTFAVPANVVVAIDGIGGGVTVRTWDRNQLRVETEDEDGRPALTVSRTDGRVMLEPAWRRGRAHVEVTLTVPVGASIEIDAAMMDVDIDGVRGEISVSTAHGEITVHGGSRFVRLHTSQGDIELSDATGRMEVSSLNGEVDVENVEGALTAATVNGDVTLHGVRSEAVEAGTTNGDIEYDGTLSPRGRYTFTTHGGDVTVTVPTGTSATVTVSSFSGGVESDFPITLRGTESGGKRFTFTLGAGEGRIELGSFSGTIHLRRP